MAKRYTQETWQGADEALAKAASDPNCKNQQECLDELARRKAMKEAQEKQEAARAEGDVFAPGRSSFVPRTSPVAAQPGHHL